MKLFLISQDANSGYDTFDSAVVAAENEEAARNTYPHEDGWPADDQIRWSVWCARPYQVTVRYLGEAAEGTPASVICASFNAG